MGKVTPQILMTFINIHKNIGKTIYSQLYEQLKNGVYSGMLMPGDRLPSSREMSLELKVSRNTVLQVFDQLRMEGFFESKIGAGTFISGSVFNISHNNRRKSPVIKNQASPVSFPNGLNNAFEGHISALEPMIPFQQSVPSVAEFPFDTWTRINASVHRNIRSLHLGYDDAQGYEPLRKVLADHLRISRSIVCDPGNIVIVNSSRQALHLAAEMLIQHGDHCWMEDPGYPGAVSAMKRFGGQICPVPVAADGIDIDFAIRHYPNAKLAYVSPSHQFPTGCTMTLDKRIRLLNWARQNDMWIIEDDYDSEFSYNTRPVPALQGLDTSGNVIYLGTFSKVLLPALRLGYMVFPSAVMARRFAIGKSAIDGQTNIIIQAVVSEFIREGHFSRHIRKMRLLYKNAQEDLVKLIHQHLKGKLEPVPVRAGMHFLAWLSAEADASLIADKALKHGVILNSLERYSLQSKNRNGLILGFSGFSFAEMEKAVLVLKRIFNEPG
jgi:GntR family transcriptional regulator/MocR family aminotransferase